MTVQPVPYWDTRLKYKNHFGFRAFVANKKWTYKQ